MVKQWLMTLGFLGYGQLLGESRTDCNTQTLTCKSQSRINAYQGGYTVSIILRDMTPVNLLISSLRAVIPPSVCLAQLTVPRIRIPLWRLLVIIKLNSRSTSFQIGKAALKGQVSSSTSRLNPAEVLI